MDWATRWEETVRRKLAFGITVAELAREAGMSGARFRRQYREIRGCSPREFLGRARAERACQLLRSTDLSIADVARACGYRSIATFCHRFRAVMGDTPSAWRRANRL
jgi:AraC-like DNA-binding protein